MEEQKIEELADRLHSASIKLLRLLRREDNASGLSAPRLSALSVIVFAGPLSLAALAAAEQVRPPTMSRIVDALVGEGLATRDISVRDRRSVRIAATVKGTHLMQSARKRRVDLLTKRLSQLAGSDQRSLGQTVQLLEQLLRG